MKAEIGSPSRRLHIWHPFTQEALEPPPLAVSRAEGVYLYTEDGRRILDGISSWWVNLHGHAHPHIARAVADQAARLEHVVFAGVTHDAAARLSAELGAVAPDGLSRVFFSDDGSTAVEVALKMALQFWKNQGRPRFRLIALDHAYHGDTAGAMSVGADSPFTAAFETMRFPVERAHSAYCHKCPVGKKRESCSIDCLDSIARILEQHADETAAVIVEPLLQGAGGMIMHPVEFLQGIRKLTREHGVLLIADEVLTGFGRTGAMFACDRAGIAPDIMCLSKGLTGGFLPFAATLATEEIYNAFDAPDRMRTFFHGHSYAGNPLGCAAAVANLEIFRNEPVFERIRTISRIHGERLPAFLADPRVGDARSLGTVAAIELNADDAGYLSEIRPALYRFFLDRDLLLRPLGNIIYILPPYVITPEELNGIYDLIGEAIEQVVRE
jgi:adenosylmethionine-8-amino-7-oxononanoate aminotransferase